MLQLRAKNKYSWIDNLQTPDDIIVEVVMEGENRLFELVKKEDINKYFEELKNCPQVTTTPNMVVDPEAERREKIEEYLNTTLNTDPFGFGYSHKTLRDIFEQDTDRAWINLALKRMKNPYILERLKFLVEALDNEKKDRIEEGNRETGEEIFC